MGKGGKHSYYLPNASSKRMRDSFKNSFLNHLLQTTIKWSTRPNPEWVCFSVRISLWSHLTYKYLLSNLRKHILCLNPLHHKRKSEYQNFSKQAMVEVNLPVSLTSHFLYPNWPGQCGQDLRHPQHWGGLSGPLFAAWPPRNKSKEETQYSQTFQRWYYILNVHSEHFSHWFTWFITLVGFLNWKCYEFLAGTQPHDDELPFIIHWVGILILCGEFLYLKKINVYGCFAYMYVWAPRTF